MTAPSSLIGFALVFAVGAIGLGFALAVWDRIRPAAPAADPAGEARRYAGRLLIGPLVGGLVAALLLARTSLGAAFGWADHCLEHGEHLHLCIVHGQGWLDRPLVVVLVGLLFVPWGLQAGRLLARVLRGRRALAALRAVTAPVESPVPGLALRLVEGGPAHLFLAPGRWPTVFASRALWEALDATERRAVLEHESAHLHRRDAAWDVLLNAVAPLGPPGVARGWHRRWAAAVERACDAHSAREVGEVAVASALVKVARHMAAAPTPAAATPGLAFAGEGVEARVHALLGTGATAGTISNPGPSPRRVGLSLLLGAVVLFAASDTLHHAFESLLGDL